MVKKFHPRKYSIGEIPSFLHLGLDQCFALSTIKGQISALAFLFQRLLASHSLKKFVQGVIYIILSVRSQ